MTYVHRLRFNTQKKDTFTSPRTDVPFNPSRASKRPTARVRTQPSPEIRAYPADPSSRCRGLFQEITKVRSEMFTRVLVDVCFSSSSLFLSRHGPCVVRSAQLFHRPNCFIQHLHPSRCSQPILTIVCFFFLFCTSDVSSIPQKSHHLVMESGIRGQQNTNPANFQCCCNSGFVPTSAQFFAVSTFLILRSPS